MCIGLLAHCFLALPLFLPSHVPSAFQWPGLLPGRSALPHGFPKGLMGPGAVVCLGNHLALAAGATSPWPRGVGPGFGTGWHHLAPGCCLAHLGGGPLGLGFARPCLAKEPLGGLGMYDPDDPDGCIGVTGCAPRLAWPSAGVTRSTTSGSDSGGSGGGNGLCPMPGVLSANIVRRKLMLLSSPCFLLLIFFCYYLSHLSFFFTFQLCFYRHHSAWP